MVIEARSRLPYAPHLSQMANKGHASDSRTTADVHLQELRAPKSRRKMIRPIRGSTIE